MFTYTEELKIKEGDVKPPSIDLLILIELALNRYMAKFRNEMKIVPLFREESQSVAINGDANMYRSQILNLISQISKQVDTDLNQTVKKFKRVFIGIVGISVNWNQINNVNQETWENFVDDKMDEIFEQLAGTTIEGKTEYEDLT